MPRRDQFRSGFIDKRAVATERGENLVGILDPRRPTDVELVARQDLTLAVRQGHHVLLISSVVLAFDSPNSPTTPVMEVHPRMSPDFSDSDLKQIRLALDIGILDRCSEVADTSSCAIEAYKATDAEVWLADNEPAEIRLADRLGGRPANCPPARSVGRTTPPHQVRLW